MTDGIAERPILYDHVWWWRKWLGERKGHSCRIFARGRGRGPRNVGVEFLDGFRVVAPRYSVRRAGPGDDAPETERPGRASRLS